MSKLPRGVYALWLSFDKNRWTLIGKDMEEFAYELNPEVSTFKNILGESTATHNGYTPSGDIQYAARSEDAIYENIKGIADNLYSDDEHCRAYMISAILDEEVKDSETTVLTGTGYEVAGLVSVTSVGGDTSGLSMPFTFTEDGARTQGTVSVSKKVPTFTANNGSSAEQTADF